MVDSTTESSFSKVYQVCGSGLSYDYGLVKRYTKITIYSDKLQTLEDCKKITELIDEVLNRT